MYRKTRLRNCFKSSGSTWLDDTLGELIAPADVRQEGRHHVGDRARVVAVVHQHVFPPAEPHDGAERARVLAERFPTVGRKVRRAMLLVPKRVVLAHVVQAVVDEVADLAFLEVLFATILVVDHQHAFVEPLVLVFFEVFRADVVVKRVPVVDDSRVMKDAEVHPGGCASHDHPDERATLPPLPGFLALSGEPDAARCPSEDQRAKHIDAPTREPRCEPRSV